MDNNDLNYDDDGNKVTYLEELHGSANRNVHIIGVEIFKQ